MYNFFSRYVHGQTDQQIQGVYYPCPSTSGGKGNKQMVTEPGTHPSTSEQLTNFVSDGSHISLHSLMRNIGQGSNKQDFVVELGFNITFTTLY